MTLKAWKAKVGSWKEKQLTQRRASKAFKAIVAERTLAERRRAYEKESLKVASEQGAAKARQPSFISQISGYAANRVFPVRKPVARGVPVRRRIVHRRAPRRAYGYAPYGYAPVRRAPRRRARRVSYQRAPAPVRQPQQQFNQPYTSSDVGNLF